ncbi:membrane protein [Alphaproteobacteria bacterium]|nr:membrane protein [Alphaproteobacteria bacterium]
MNYEWDETKRAANLRKHGLDFVDVGLVFDDPFLLEFIDTRTDYGEQRLIAVGLYKNLVVTIIVYTDKRDVRRIISFRKASKREEKIYYDNI